MKLITILSIIQFAYRRKYLIFWCIYKNYFIKILKLLKQLQIILGFKILSNRLCIYLNFLYKIPAVTLINYYYSRRSQIFLSFLMIKYLLWLITSSVWLFLTPFGLQPHWILLKYKCGGILLTQIL